MDRQVSYIIAVISDFAEHFGLSNPQAYRYLARYKGIDFLQEFYDVEIRFLLRMLWRTWPAIAGTMEERWHDSVSRLQCGCQGD